MEQDDSGDEDSDETSECAEVHNLAAADNEFVGAFNRLAQVDAFDRGAFEGAEELLGDIGDVGELSTMQGVGRNWDVANAYVQFPIEPVEIELSSDAFQRVAFSIDHALKEYRRFDLNASDSLDDELPAKRFDLNDSDPSDDESPDIGRLSMLRGGPSSQDAAAVAKAAADAAADAAAAIRSTKKAAKAARTAAADAADAARARATYGATTKTSLPPGIFIASTDTILFSNQRFVLAVTQSLVDSGIAPHSALGIVFEITAMRRHHVQARIPPEGVQARVPPGCLFQIPKSELWRAVVLEQELAPRYVPAVGSDAFSDAHPLSTAATNEQEWTRGRLAHKFLEGVAHGLLIAPRPVSAQHAGDNVPPDDRPVAPPARPSTVRLTRRR
jgi:hypothetical protein